MAMARKTTSPRRERFIRSFPFPFTQNEADFKGGLNATQVVVYHTPFSRSWLRGTGANDYWACVAGTGRRKDIAHPVAITTRHPTTLYQRKAMCVKKKQ